MSQTEPLVSIRVIHNSTARAPNKRQRKKRESRTMQAKKNQESTQSPLTTECDKIYIDNNVVQNPFLLITH